MGTVKQYFSSGVLIPRSGTAMPLLGTVAGTNFPVPSYGFDATTEQTIFTFPFTLLNFGASNSSITVTYRWYADTASSGGVAVGFSIKSMSPNTEAADIETMSFAAESIITDTHLGTVGQRPHDAIGTLANIDGAVDGELAVVRVARKVSDGSDTMTGYMNLLGFLLSWSDS